MIKNEYQFNSTIAVKLLVWNFKELKNERSKYWTT